MLQKKKKKQILDYHYTEKARKTTSKEPERETEIDGKINFYFQDEVKGIQGTYTVDLDLSQIFTLVIDCLQFNKETFLPSMQSNLEMSELMYSDTKSNLSVIDKRELELDIEKMKAYVKFLTNSVRDFDIEVKPLLASSANLIVDKLDLNSDNYRRKHNLITDFIAVLKRYIPINLVYTLNINSACLCNKPPKTYITTQEGSKMCPMCKVEINVYDTNRSSAIPKTAYDDWTIFHNAISTFQGMQTKMLPNDLEKKLDNYFVQQNLPVGHDVRKQPHIEKGKKEGTSRHIMSQALIAIGYESYLNDLLLIMSNYWGWILPNIERHMDEIQKRYYQSKVPYNEFKSDRKSSLGAQYRLFQILYSMDFDVDASDFKLVMTPTLQREYNDIWSQVAQKLGWAWKSL